MTEKVIELLKYLSGSSSKMEVDAIVAYNITIISRGSRLQISNLIANAMDIFSLSSCKFLIPTYFHYDYKIIILCMYFGRSYVVISVKIVLNYTTIRE